MKKRAFTLIELLVVIGIIILLIGILLPVMSSVRKSATAATTTALLNHLRDDIDGYYTTFGAYPGPAPASMTAGPGKQLSGAQNLLVGLSYALVNPSSPGASLGAYSVPFPGPGGFKVDPLSPNGPLNYAQISPMTGKPEQLGAFFDATSGRLSKQVATVQNTWPKAGVVGAAGSNNFAFPVIVDTFNDGLPILYYRRSAGVEAPPNPSDTPPAAFFWGDNSEYTSSSTLQATSGLVCSQVQKRVSNKTYTSLLSDASHGSEDLVRLNNDLPPAPPNVPAGTGIKGGYMLISAGPDRMYGTSQSNTGADRPRDDIVVVGGH